MYVHAPKGIAAEWFANSADLIVAFPQYSININPLPEELTQYEIYPVERVEVPLASDTQHIVRELPEFVDGVWRDRLVLKDFTPEEIEQFTPNKVAQLKLERSRQLYETDWTQVPDNPLPPADREAWRVFREELRNLTSQTGFPWNIVWPTPPVPLTSFIAFRR
jgi:hypothetical protein